MPDAVKALYLQTPATGTVVSTAVDGAPQRVIRTRSSTTRESGSLRALPRALANAHAFRKETDTTLLALLKGGERHETGQRPDVAPGGHGGQRLPMMTRAALVDGRTDVGVLPTGQVVGAIEELPTVEELITRVIGEAGAVLGRLSAP